MNKNKIIITGLVFILIISVCINIYQESIEKPKEKHHSAMDSIWYASNDYILLEDLGSDSFILFEILEDNVSIKFYPRTREGLFDLSMESTEIFFHMIDTSWNFGG